LSVDRDAREDPEHCDQEYEFLHEVT
jgi:hypothetical protein